MASNSPKDLEPVNALICLCLISGMALLWSAQSCSQRRPKAFSSAGRTPIGGFVLSYMAVCSHLDCSSCLVCIAGLGAESRGLGSLSGTQQPHPASAPATCSSEEQQAPSGQQAGVGLATPQKTPSKRRPCGDTQVHSRLAQHNTSKTSMPQHCVVMTACAYTAARWRQHSFAPALECDARTGPCCHQASV